MSTDVKNAHGGARSGSGEAPNAHGLSRRNLLLSSTTLGSEAWSPTGAAGTPTLVSPSGARSWRSATPTAICRCCKWTTAGDGPRFALIVHHTDAEREWAHDRDSHIGRLDKALDEANAKGWTVVDMKDD